MKKFASLVAMIIALVVLTTNAFAFSGAVTDATLDGTVITCTADGAFVFTYVGSMEVKGGSSVKCDVKNLVNAGWTVTDVDGAWSPSSDATTSFSNNLIQVKWPAGSNYDLTGQVMLQFTATPGASVDFTTASFKVSPTISKAAGGLYNTATTYTLAEKKGAEAPTYTEVTDGEGVFQGVNDIYTGVWTGAYTVTLNGNAADKVKVDFDATHSYEVDVDAAGEGAIAFKLAVVGAPKNATAVPSVFGTEWVAAVKAE